MQTLRDLFEFGLMDAYDSETRILGALDEMIRDATDPRLRDLFTKHREETRGQIDRLRRAFDAVGREPSGGEGSRPVMGMVAERAAFKEKRPSPEVLRTFDVGAAMKVEHVEIAGYTALVELSRKLGLNDVASLLGQNLAEETAALRKLESLAAEDLRDAAGQGQRATGRPAQGGMGR
jgi:ferritin-like metal-binding protein YciE